MKTLTDADFTEFLGTQESQFIVRASEITDSLVDRILNGPEYRGSPLPWSKTETKYRMRECEVTLWAGVSGHGKSLITSQIMAWLLPTERVLIASMEMPLITTMERMVKQVSGTPEPRIEFAKVFMGWTDNRLWLYDQTDSVEPERIIGMVHYSATKLKINHIVIDSLMKCGIKPDDYNRQAEFVDALCWAAKKYKLHIHLIHHVRKGQKEGIMPDKYDIKGAGEIINLVDNICVMHRVKEKTGDKEPDCFLDIMKQRHGEWEGKIALWWHKSGQYLADPGNCVMPYPADIRINGRDTDGPWGVRPHKGGLTNAESRLYSAHGFRTEST